MGQQGRSGMRLKKTVMVLAFFAMTVSVAVCVSVLGSVTVASVGMGEAGK